jgi:hypothetical protein
MKKLLVVGIILLFIGLSIPSTGTIVEKKFLESYENFSFGYRLFDPISQYDPGPIFFELDDPGTVYTLAYDNNTITGGCYNPYIYTWYVCDDMSYIWTINIWSGDISLIGGSGEGLSALAYDPQTDTMYGAYDEFLCGIDMQTGERLWVWDISEYFLGSILGMAANGNGHLYIVGTTDDLWRFDLDSAILDCVGPLFIDIKGNADLEFDYYTGILYLSTYTTQGELYKVNTWLGEATLIGPFEEGARISGFIIPWNWPPYPPEPPQITGPQYGKINVEYEYNFVSTHPEGDDLTYIIDWGDGSDIEEHGWYPSGEKITVKHAWCEEGTYTIKAKAREIGGLESSWAYYHVAMPKNKMMYNLFLLNIIEQFPIIKLLIDILE